MMPGPGGFTETAMRSPVRSARSKGAPAIASSIRAASATVVASGPFSSRPPQLSVPTCAGTTPAPGLMPNNPHAAAGMRTEPSPSVPCATGTSPAATAAADPPDDPPGVRRRSHGLRAIPNALSVNGKIDNSGRLVSPTTTAPAARRRATTG